MGHSADAHKGGDLDRIKALIDTAIGPAPWYWQTFPTLYSGERVFKWRSYGTTGKLAYVTVLEEEGVGKPLIALNTAVWPFAANQGYLGVWYSTGRYDHVEVQTFKLDDLRVIKSFRARAQIFKKSLQNYLLHDSTPAESVQIPQGLSKGRHKGPVLESANTLTELLLLTSPPGEGLVHSIYVWHPASGMIDVLPQKWFREEDIDPGYHWITRVARDPQTGHIVGGGIRILGFELDDSGMRLKRSI